jgi:hypothetical protein
MKLEHLAYTVGASICLYNLCVMHNDFPDLYLDKKYEAWLQKGHWDFFQILKI